MFLKSIQQTCFFDENWAQLRESNSRSKICSFSFLTYPSVRKQQRRNTNQSFATLITESFHQQNQFNFEQPHVHKGWYHRFLRFLLFCMAKTIPLSSVAMFLSAKTILVFTTLLMLLVISFSTCQQEVHVLNVKDFLSAQDNPNQKIILSKNALENLLYGAPRKK